MKVPLQWGCMERLIHFVEISFVRVVFFLYDRERNQTNPGLSFLVSRVIVMDFRVPHITIRIDALSISVSVQLWHVRYHISSTLSRGQSISWDHQAVSWCGTYATVPIRFLGAEGCLSEETGTFTLRCKELTRDFYYFERSFSTKNRLILIQNRELQIIRKN